MGWIVFSYSLPTEASTARVGLWRRLRRLGAISPTGGVFILPANDDCVEAFQWLAQEVHQAEGEALVMQVRQFEGMDDGQVMALFNKARREEYEEMLRELKGVALEVEASDGGDDMVKFQGVIQKVQKQLADIAKIDYFQSTHRTAVTTELNQILRRIMLGSDGAVEIEAAVIDDYRQRRWVTRPRPHVDRLACAWLIRRYIDPEAIIRYSLTVESDEVGFDMDGATFSHLGNLCTFEVMMRAFELKDQGLTALAEIVHEIDLRDGRYQRLETVGIDATLRGWLLADVSDSDLEMQGLALIDGLFATLSQSGLRIRNI